MALRWIIRCVWGNWARGIEATGFWVHPAFFVETRTGCPDTNPVPDFAIGLETLQSRRHFESSGAGYLIVGPRKAEKLSYHRIVAIPQPRERVELQHIKHAIHDAVVAQMNSGDLTENNAI